MRIFFLLFTMFVVSCSRGNYIPESAVFIEGEASVRELSRNSTKTAYALICNASRENSLLKVRFQVWGSLVFTDAAGEQKLFTVGKSMSNFSVTLVKDRENNIFSVNSSDLTTILLGPK